MSAFWSAFVIVIVTLNIVGSLWVLFANARAEPGETTGHTWDEDLTEYNKPLPRWWMGMFVLSVVFSIGYLVLYPGFGSFAGSLGWSSAKQHDTDVADANAKLDTLFAQFRGRPVAELAHDPKALAIGRNVFANHCAACHGSGGRGAPGFPNLTDDDWLYGGDAETVVKTIADGRHGAMPPWEAMLGDRGVRDVAQYVRQLGGLGHNETIALAGKERFAVCAACHGIDGKGNRALGAPNLTDDVWLYGSDFASLEATIRHGRNGNMPAWQPILGDDRVRLVAAWVLSLSHPPAAAPTDKAAP
ncbi:MAG TPA: cytochrome-c oxidase, cbb3-type subunit III [Tahibacter sp.]|nr:cytochrome-c oxidase, cbb3-type subunit III [Tahibacter sp.]